MEKCMRCGKNMIDNFTIKGELLNNKKNIKINKIYARICPNCGNIEIYIKDKEKDLIDKDKKIIVC